MRRFGRKTLLTMILVASLVVWHGGSVAEDPELDVQVRSWQVRCQQMLASETPEIFAQRLEDTKAVLRILHPDALDAWLSQRAIDIRNSKCLPFDPPGPVNITSRLVEEDVGERMLSVLDAKNTSLEEHLEAFLVQGFLNESQASEIRQGWRIQEQEWRTIAQSRLGEIVRTEVRQAHLGKQSKTFDLWLCPTFDYDCQGSGTGMQMEIGTGIDLVDFSVRSEKAYYGDSTLDPANVVFELAPWVPAETADDVFIKILHESDYWGSCGSQKWLGIDDANHGGTYTKRTQWHDFQGGFGYCTPWRLHFRYWVSEIGDMHRVEDDHSYAVGSAHKEKPVCREWTWSGCKKWDHEVTSFNEGRDQLIASLEKHWMANYVYKRALGNWRDDGTSDGWVTYIRFYDRQVG